MHQAAGLLQIIRILDSLLPPSKSSYGFANSTIDGSVLGPPAAHPILKIGKLPARYNFMAALQALLSQV